MTYARGVAGQEQRTTTLPRGLNRRFGDLVKARGVTRASVLYALLREAAAAVVAGQGDLLPKAPPSGRLERGSVGPVDEVRWTQGLAEYTDWCQLYESVGSSLVVVARARVAAYVEAGGDSVRMSWAVKRTLSTAA
jgi:hypothetical protein